MKDIGFFGHKLQAATQKVRNAKTPQEKSFRTALINNDKAREVVDKVDFVKGSMEELDKSKVDTDPTEGGVQVDAQAKQLGKFKRNSPGLVAPLDAITTQAPEGQTAPTVTGTLTDGNMKVDVRHPDGNTTFGLTREENGKVVYQAGSDLVTMNSDGTLSMSVSEQGQQTPTPPKAQPGPLSKGMESSGQILKRVMGDAANFGNKVGKSVGLDEQAPGLRGFAGTTISMTTTMVGGLVAMPLALIVGAADAMS